MRYSARPSECGHDQRKYIPAFRTVKFSGGGDRNLHQWFPDCDSDSQRCPGILDHLHGRGDRWQQRCEGPGGQCDDLEFHLVVHHRGRAASSREHVRARYGAQPRHPAVVDSGDVTPVELGFRFRSDVAGTITSLRFYKSHCQHWQLTPPTCGQIPELCWRQLRSPAKAAQVGSRLISAPGFDHGQHHLCSFLLCTQRPLLSQQQLTSQAVWTMRRCTP